MPQVTLSSKYQLVIPKEIRRQLHLKGGQKIQMVVKDGIISLVPDYPLEKLRGYLGQMDTSVEREDDRC